MLGLYDVPLTALYNDSRFSGIEKYIANVLDAYEMVNKLLNPSGSFGSLNVVEYLS